MIGFFKKNSLHAAVAILFILSLSEVRAEPLREIGVVEITVDGDTEVYKSLAVQVGDGGFRSSTYIGPRSYMSEGSSRQQYAIAITGFEDPSISADLNQLIPIEADRSITVFAFIDSKGKEIRDAGITWEADPERNFYWGSDKINGDVTLDIESFDLDPNSGNFIATFNGVVCYMSLPNIKKDNNNCKNLSVHVDSELTKLY